MTDEGEPTNTQIHTAIIRMEGTVNAIKAKQDQMSLILTGNGKPSEGVVVQLDRVKEKQKLIWFGFFGAIVAVTKAFWNDITGK